MDAGKITKKQAAVIHGHLVEADRYLGRLRNRMAELGFSLDDRLFRKVYLAQATLHDLIEELHAKAYIETYGSRSDRGR